MSSWVSHKHSSLIQHLKLWHNHNNNKPPQLRCQLPNIAVCLVCTIVPLLWLSGRFASPANGSGASLLPTCHWFAYREMQEIRERARRKCHMEGKQKRCKAPCSGSHPALCESGTDFWVGGDLITYAHSQLRVMLNPAALAQMTQNNTEQNVKENRAQNNTAKKITRVPKYI